MSLESHPQLQGHLGRDWPTHQDDQGIRVPKQSSLGTTHQVVAELPGTYILRGNISIRRDER